MSGAWYVLAMVVVALIIRWFLANDIVPTTPKRPAQTLNNDLQSKPK